VRSQFKNPEQRVASEAKDVHCQPNPKCPKILLHDMVVSLPGSLIKLMICTLQGKLAIITEHVAVLQQQQLMDF
jgi:hypothetical protein